MTVSIGLEGMLWHSDIGTVMRGVMTVSTCLHSVAVMANPDIMPYDVYLGGPNEAHKQGPYTLIL